MKKPWIKYQEEHLCKQLTKDIINIIFTAQEGSTLDKIWKGKFKTKK